jgi:hypothetical protein
LIYRVIEANYGELSGEEKVRLVEKINELLKEQGELLK